MTRRQNSLKNLAVVAAVALPWANAGFSASSTTNIAVYWGASTFSCSFLVS